MVLGGAILAICGVSLAAVSWAAITSCHSCTMAPPGGTMCQSVCAPPYGVLVLGLVIAVAGSVLAVVGATRKSADEITAEVLGGEG